MKNIRFVFYVIILAAVWYLRHNPSPQSGTGGGSGNAAPALMDAIRNHASDVQVEGSGKVVKVLPDDTTGDKHQRFIIELASGDTLLVAHNIDIAPRVEGLREGNEIFFKGYYVWTEKGGVVHWTHHDPSGRHATGYLKLDGKTYQ